MRLAVQLGFVSSATVCLLVVASGFASADCHGDGVNYGSNIAYAGPSGSSQSLAWNLSNRTSTLASSTGSGCTFSAASARAWTHTSHAILLRAQNGTVDFNNGGVPSDANN